MGGTNSGMGNDFAGYACGGTGDDVTFTWTAPSAGIWTFDVSYSDFDTVLYVLDGCAGAELACNDDAVGLASVVDVALSRNQEVVVVVDGYGASSVGSFDLLIY